MNDLIELFSYPIKKLVICLSSLQIDTVSLAAIIAAGMVFIIIHRIFFSPISGNDGT